MKQLDTFEKFMLDYQNMVFTTALRLLASEAEAKDISQEVFLKAFQRFDELRGSPTAGGWLRTVTTNLCLNHLTRYRKRWRFFSEFFSDEADENQPAYEVPAAEVTGEHLEEAEQRQVLEEALAKLPPAQRVPLILYHFENLTYEEIARSLRVSLSKVKTDIFRGREALKRKLSARGAAEEVRSIYMVKTPEQPPRDSTLRILTQPLTPRLL